jgi:hypothetical protein
MTNTEKGKLTRLATRPFVSGQPVVTRLTPDPRTPDHSGAPTRPFVFGRRADTTRTSAAAVATTGTAASGWSVAVYSPDLEREEATAESRSPEPSVEARDDMASASLALAEAVNDAGRHAASFAAAGVLDAVARRLRSGEILLPPGIPTQPEAAVVASVLTALLGERR